MLQADALTRVAGVSPPAQRDPRFDGHPCPHPRWQHLPLIGNVLRGEPFHARHRNHARGNAVLGKLLARRDRDLHLAAGRDEDHRGVAAGRLGEDVPAAGGAFGAGEAVTGANALRGGRPVEHWEALPAQAQRGRPVGVLEDGAPGHHGLVCVGRPYHVEAGDGPQRPQVLDRLVGRPVLTEPDRVMRPDIGHRQPHQGSEPDRGAHVVAEDQERATVGPGQPAEGYPAADGPHAVLPDPEMQGAAVWVAGEQPGLVFGWDERRLALHRRVVAAGQVG